MVSKGNELLYSVLCKVHVLLGKDPYYGRQFPFANFLELEPQVTTENQAVPGIEGLFFKLQRRVFSSVSEWSVHCSDGVV